MTPTLGTQAFALARKGKTWAEIAAALGVPYHTAYRAAHVKARALGVPVTLEPLRRGVRPRYPMTCALRAKGLTLPEAAARLGVSAVALGKWVRGTARPRERYVAALRELLGDAVDLGLGKAVVPVRKPCMGPKPRHPLTRALHEAGHTCGDAARRLGVAAGSLSRWVAGSRPAPRHLAALRIMLGDKVDALFPAPIKRQHSGPTPRTGTKGERAYDLRREGLSWVAISEDLGLIINSADTYARRYARTRSLPWPPE